MGREIDWSELRRRIEALGAEERETPARAAQILEDRARRLAEARPAPDHARSRDVVTFVLAGERYALDVGWVREIVLSAAIVPLPGSVPPIVGVTNVRGQVLMVADLRPVLRMEEATPGACVVVVGRDRPEIAVLLDEPGEVQGIAAGDVLAAPPAQGARPVVSGVSRDGTILLAAERLLELATGLGEERADS